MKRYLYDIFAEKWLSKDNSLWLYSDPHFGDAESAVLRNDSVSDDEQIRRINSKVGKNDTLILLGDIGDVEFVKKLRGYKVLILGNHDKGASNYRRSVTIAANTENADNTKVLDNHLFDEVYEGPLMISDKVILSHEPISNLPEYMFNIHGHDHGNWFTGSRHLNLCAEHIDYTPVNFTSIIKDGLLKDVKNIHRTSFLLERDIASKIKDND